MQEQLLQHQSVTVPDVMFPSMPPDANAYVGYTPDQLQVALCLEKAGFTPPEVWGLNNLIGRQTSSMSELSRFWKKTKVDEATKVLFQGMLADMAKQSGRPGAALIASWFFSLFDEDSPIGTEVAPAGGNQIQSNRGWVSGGGSKCDFNLKPTTSDKVSSHKAPNVFLWFSSLCNVCLHDVNNITVWYFVITCLYNTISHISHDTSFV
jgi:hypothetical protein